MKTKTRFWLKFTLKNIFHSKKTKNNVFLLLHNEFDQKMQFIEIFYYFIL